MITFLYLFALALLLLAVRIAYLEIRHVVEVNRELTRLLIKNMMERR